MPPGNQSDTLASLLRKKPRPIQPDLFPPPSPEPPPQPEKRIWSVRALVTNIRAHTESAYADIWVEGEISGCRPAASGHIYFTLKDGDAQLPIVLFRRQALLLRFRPQDGLAVLVRGRVSIYESRGQLQLIAETLEPRGTGALQIAFEQLKTRLAAEGLFDSARKRSLPAFPHCIGIVTSSAGAVLRDIATVIRRRHARLNLLIYPALMQGPTCSTTVAAGIRWFNAHPEKVDLILIARGGGSPEDLAGFNDESLARAIAASKLPTVSAIGHETDFTIADFVADLRAPTPSAAAELITAAQHRIEDRVASLATRLIRAASYRLILARQRYATLSADSVLIRLRDTFGRRQQRLDDLAYRAESALNRRLRTPATRLANLTARLQQQAPTARLAISHRRLARADEALTRTSSRLLTARRTRLAHASARLEALSPLSVLNRGYALVYAVRGPETGQDTGAPHLASEMWEPQTSEPPPGQLLRSTAGLHPGQQIRARLAFGSLTATVSSTQLENPQQ